VTAAPARTANLTCPCCQTPGVRPFYEVDRVPVNSVLLLETRQEALDFPVGTISLGLCEACGFVYNTTFDPELLEYSGRYDPTQAYSPTFNTWHRALAERLVDTYGLHDKKVVEIGCGKGEFLNMLCEIGPNRGVGFDPAYSAERNTSLAKDRIEFVVDFYSEKYEQTKGDFVCCKMTLEHISPVERFMQTVRRSVGDDQETVVFFQVPDVERILEETAFWDVYYEHCSYFSMGSLGRVFQRTGFDVVGLAREYDNQYLMIDARPAGGAPRTLPPQANDLERIGKLAGDFAERLSDERRRWSERIAEYEKSGKKVVVWGSGSKGVSFLTTLGVSDGIEFVVDINPHRQGFYMASTGQRIVGPEFLESYLPDVVIVMNPVYEKEIREDLHGRGLEPEVLTT
jgi:SAM-dependent methyltransferase